MPAGLGRVDGGNQWYVEVLSQRDRRMSDQPIVRVHHVGPPRLGAGALDGQTRSDHRVAHRQRPGHHVAAEVELVRILCRGDNAHALGDLVGRRMRARVGAAWPAAEHHHFVAGLGQRRREVMDVAP